MKVWKDKQGNKLTAKEFAARWKEGVQKITPLQQAKSNLIGYIIILAGIIYGIVTAFIFKQWWLMVILVGSFIVSSTAMLGGVQKYIILDRMEKTLREVSNEDTIKNC